MFELATATEAVHVLYSFWIGVTIVFFLVILWAYWKFRNQREKLETKSSFFLSRVTIIQIFSILGRNFTVQINEVRGQRDRIVLKSHRIKYVFRSEVRGESDEKKNGRSQISDKIYRPKSRARKTKSKNKGGDE